MIYYKTQAPPWGLSTLAKEFSTAACIMQSSLNKSLKPIFRVCFLLGVSFNLDNRILLVSRVDLLKTKFIISLRELRVDHCFLLQEKNIFLFRLEFSSIESTEAFTESTDPGQLLLLSAIILLSDLTQLPFEGGQHTKTTISLR